MRTKVILPHPIVRYLFEHKEIGEKRGNWMTNLQEYYLEIKLAKIIHGQGLWKLAIEAQHKKDEVEEETFYYKRDFWKDPGWENEAYMYEREVLQTPTTTNTWYYELKYYLSQGACLEYLDSKKRWALILKFSRYHLINDVLFCKKNDGVLLRCLEKDDAYKVLKELHDGHVGGNYGG